MLLRGLSVDRLADRKTLLKSFDTMRRNGPMAEKGVRVNVLTPGGMVDTQLFGPNKMPEYLRNTAGQHHPDTTSSYPAAVWLASDDSADVTGASSSSAKEFNVTGADGVRASLSGAAAKPTMPTSGTVSPSPPGCPPPSGHPAPPSLSRPPARASRACPDPPPHAGRACRDPQPHAGQAVNPPAALVEASRETTAVVEFSTSSTIECCDLVRHADPRRPAGQDPSPHAAEPVETPNPTPVELVETRNPRWWSSRARFPMLVELVETDSTPRWPSLSRPATPRWSSLSRPLRIMVSTSSTIECCDLVRTRRPPSATPVELVETTSAAHRSANGTGLVSTCSAATVSADAQLGGHGCRAVSADAHGNGPAAPDAPHHHPDQQQQQDHVEGVEAPCVGRGLGDELRTAVDRRRSATGPTHAGGQGHRDVERLDLVGANGPDRRDRLAIAGCRVDEGSTWRCRWAAWWCCARSAPGCAPARRRTATGTGPTRSGWSRRPGSAEPC